MSITYNILDISFGLLNSSLRGKENDVKQKAFEEILVRTQRIPLDVLYAASKMSSKITPDRNTTEVWRRPVNQGKNHRAFKVFGPTTTLISETFKLCLKLTLLND